MYARTTRAVIQLLTTALVTGLILYVQPDNHLSYVWPLTGLQAVIAWNEWDRRSSQALQLLATLTGYIAACLLSGWSPLLAFEMAAVQSFEVWVTLSILRPEISRFADLKEQKRVRLFGAVAVGVPLVTAGLRAIVFHRAIHASLLLTWFVTGMSHSVGLLVVLPALLFVLSLTSHAPLGTTWTHWKLGLAAQLLVLIITLATFSQNTYPLLFMVLPPVVLAVLVGGLEGATISSLTVTSIACYATALHHGPVWLISAMNSGLRTAILQIFLAMVVGTALPVGALLDEREAANKEVREGRSIYRTLLDHSQDMILLSSMDGSTRYVSPGVKAISGWTPAEFLSFQPLDTMHEEDRPLAQGIIASLHEGKTEHHFRYRMRCKDGRYLWTEASMLGYGDRSNSELTGYVATIRDISSQTRLEQALSEERDELAEENKYLQVLAGNDELTGIANRRTFNRLLAHEVNRHKRASNALSLLMIDVDFFKKYNDHYGHPMGDEVLKKVAGVLVDSSRDSDLAARVGGEEFALLLPETDAAGAANVAARVLAGIRGLQIPHVESPLEQLTLSIGSATWDHDFTSDGALLIQQADQALYESKRSGRNKAT